MRSRSTSPANTGRAPRRAATTCGSRSAGRCPSGSCTARPRATASRSRPALWSPRSATPRRACECRSRCWTPTSWTRACAGSPVRCARCAAPCATARRSRCRNLRRVASLDSVVHRERPAAGEAEGALVLLHGRATDENDLFPLIEMLDPDRRLNGYTLRGPLNLPPGGWHWYQLAGIPTPDPTTFTRTFARVSGWLDSLGEEIGVPMERTVLGGFSQGSVMSYALGLGAERPVPAGIVALSGFLPRVPGFALDPEGRPGVPV